MFGFISAVRHAERFAWIESKDGETYFAPFANFVDRPLGHTCFIKENAEVEFEFIDNRDSRRNLRPTAVNATLCQKPDFEFPTQQVESIVAVWNGQYGFSRNTQCGCQHIFLYIRDFLTADEFLTDEHLHVGSRVVADLEDAPDKQNATGRRIELFRPEVN